MPDATRNAAHRHAVQFYRSEASLFKTAAGFVAEGFIAGQPAIIIATADHRQGILNELGPQLVGVALARPNGDLVVLDANETLRVLMIDDQPDATAFHVHVGHLVETLLRDRSDNIVRAYGEIADVLWKHGRPRAALQVESFWNTLAARFHVAWLCGYSMGSFFKHAARVEDVCDLHTHIIDPRTGGSVTIAKPVTH